MDPALQLRHEELINKTAQYVREHFAWAHVESDAEVKFSHSRWRKYCQSGVMGIPIPEAYGGAGGALTTTAEAIRILSRHASDEGLLFSICAQLSTCMIPLLYFGTESQKSQYLPKLCTGEYIGGNGTSEPDAGSDLAGMETTASQVDDGHALVGVKNFATNGSVADVLIIYARHPSGIKFANISAFIVEKTFPGFSVKRDWGKLGLRTSPLSEVILNQCIVPDKNLLGRQKRGMDIFEKSMLWERIVMSAYLLGCMERQFNQVLSYARQRKQFNKPIIDFPSISNRLVDMHRNIETSAALLTNACNKYEQGTLPTSAPSLLKLHVSEGRVSNSILAMSIFGARGYTTDFPVEQQLRDAMAAPIYSGTNDIQKMIVANSLEEYR